jgi:hypothetical protein
VPTDADFKVMEENIGVPTGELNNTGFRGVSQGAYHQLKLYGDSGFDTLLTGAYIVNTGTTTLGVTNHDQTYLWSSSFSASHVISRNLISSNNGVGRQITFSANKEYAPLRCIMNRPCANNCVAPQYCNSSGVCANACVINCSGKVCGDNGCGGSCGMCGTVDTCSNGQCVLNDAEASADPTLGYH